MIFLAENMIRTQQIFQEKGLPWMVDIGYHYTKKKNMSRIKTDGLLSTAERDELQIKSDFNDEVYGSGIYTGNDPESCCIYGKEGIIVARLKGKELDTETARYGYDMGNTSIISGSLVVLQCSCQCLALLRFPRRHGHQVALEYALDLYNLLLVFFSNTDHTAIPNTLLPQSPYSHDARRRGIGTEAWPGEIRRYFAPSWLPDASTVYKVCDRSLCTKRKCPICLLDFANTKSRPIVLKKCGHMFHQECIDSALQFSRRCPVCSRWVMSPQGKMPSGKMVIYFKPSVTCTGFEAGSIIIEYTIPSGIQQFYHDNPGKLHGSLFRRAYLPHNAEGRALMERFKVAFLRGLTFTVGTSATTGLADSVMWGPIEHKISPHSDTQGFPDSGYIARCNATMDLLGLKEKPNGIISVSPKRRPTGTHHTVRQPALVVLHLPVRLADQMVSPVVVRLNTQWKAQ